MARSAQPILTIAGQDVTAMIVPSLLSLDYKEGLVFSADTVSIKFADPQGKFRLTFKALKCTAPITLTIEALNWNKAGEVLKRACGMFYIHSIKMAGSKGGGTIINLECTSTPITPKSSIRLERKSKATTQTTLKALAGQIATASGLKLQYLAPENPKIGRADQHDESDLVHLGKHCTENDLLLKIKDNGLWIMDHDQMEKQAPVGTIVCPSAGNQGGINGAGIESWDLEENVEDCYKACEVAYKDHKTGKVVRASVSDPNCQDIGHTHQHKHTLHDQDSDTTDTPTEGEDS